MKAKPKLKIVLNSKFYCSRSISEPLSCVVISQFLLYLVKQELPRITTRVQDRGITPVANIQQSDRLCACD